MVERDGPRGRAVRDVFGPSGLNVPTSVRRVSGFVLTAPIEERGALRIAFHVPRASHLKPGLSGDKVYVGRLLAGLGERGHQVRIVSRINVRNLWRRRVPTGRLLTEAVLVCKEMKRFSPDAWLVYGSSVTNPDLFGWWQRPKRYVLINTNTGKEKRLPWQWRWLFAFAHRRSLAGAN